MKQYQEIEPEIKVMDAYWKALDYTGTEEGQTKRVEWAEANPITIRTIDEELLTGK
jgi:hypothetical protein